MHKALNKEERMRIFELFLDKYTLKFSDIEKQLKIRSNALSYHLEMMKKQGLIEKNGENYQLTEDAESYIPSLSASGIGPMPVILAAIIKKDKVLLIKRHSRPYKEYWSLIGGKMHMHENIPAAALRKSKEETGIDCTFKSLNAILHERVEGKGKIKHSFMLFFVKLEPNSSKSVKAKDGKWFALSRLNKKDVIPTDYFLIRNKLNSRINIESAHMLDKESRLELKNITKI